MILVISIVVLITAAAVSVTASNNGEHEEMLAMAYDSISNNLHSTNEEEHKTMYDIFFIRSEDLLSIGELYWAKDLSFNIIQVKNMNDEELEEQINENIVAASFHWVDGWLANALMNRTAQIGASTVFLHNDRYLSFANTFHGRFSFEADTSAKFITIDMQTGQRVMLNDLVRVDEELAYKLYSCPEVQTELYWLRPRSVTTYYELLDQLHIASLTQEEVYEQTGLLLFRPSFYLRENQIVIVFNVPGGRASWPESLPHFIINLDDIQEFFLVEPW